MSAEKFAELMLEDFGKWLADEVPRLRPTEHSRIAQRAENLVHAVRVCAEANAFETGKQAAAAVVRGSKVDLVSRIEALTPMWTRDKP